MYGDLTVTLARFYFAVIVNEVWKHKNNLVQIARSFQIHKGTLQSALTQIASNANSLSRFVEELPDKFWSYISLFPQICQQLTYCCAPEIVPLMELNGVKVARAKQLYQAGYRDVQSIAKCNTYKLSHDLNPCSHKQAKALIRAARHMLRSKADELEEKAKEMMASTEGSFASLPSSDSSTPL